MAKKVLMCNDIFRGCAAEIRAATDDEVLKQAAEHARQTHDIQMIDEATKATLKSAIREE